MKTRARVLLGCLALLVLLTLACIDPPIVQVTPEPPDLVIDVPDEEYDTLYRVTMGTLE